MFACYRFENILSMVFAEIPEEESATDPIYSSLKSTVVELGLVDNKLQVQILLLKIYNSFKILMKHKCIIFRFKNAWSYMSNYVKEWESQSLVLRVQEKLPSESC